MRKTIKKIISNFGYNLIPVEQSPYSELIKEERYKPLNILLADKEFKIADSLSFYYCYKEIFTNEIYKFKSLKLEPFIVDCGANCGVSIFYFKTLFPSSKIIGIEADPYIYKILESNVNNNKLENIELINAAVWNKLTTIDFYSEGADAGRLSNNFDIIKTKQTQVNTILLSNFIKKQHIDFLKIDIEGAETEVLQECKDFLYNVSNIFIEYHSFVEEQQTLSEILTILKENKFRYQIQTAFSSNKPFVETNLQYGMDLQLNIFGYRE